MAKLNCDEDILRNFRTAVLKKHGKLYSCLKKEVNIALQERTKKILGGIINT